jgi:cell division protein FtsW (lipid II flippase)
MATSNSREVKNSGIAGILSAIFPCSGYLYLKNYPKGFVCLGTLVLFILLAVHSRWDKMVIFIIMAALLYFYQIIDSINEANKPPEEEKTDQLLNSILLIFLGGLFLMINLDFISYRSLSNYWPLIFIIFGLKIILSNYLIKEKKNGKKEG